jgi:hypothetical protein
LGFCTWKEEEEEEEEEHSTTKYKVIANNFLWGIGDSF